MAEDATEKTVKQLKKERTIAKSKFTRNINFLLREAKGMAEDELKEEFQKLSECLTNVFEANDVYHAGLAEEDSKEDSYSEQLEEIDKTTFEAEAKFKEVREVVQEQLWTNYGEPQVTASIQEAEKSCEVTVDLPVTGVNLVSFEVHLNILGERMTEAIQSMSTWERWMPRDARRTFDIRMKELKLKKNRLEERKAQFVSARRAEEELAGATSGRGGTPLVPAPVAPIKIKPVALPFFKGIKRGYHRWRQDWENLQKQGEPSGSLEVKKIQLLDSIEERIVKDLRLASYSSVEDIFRVLENRYGNRSVIALEILEDIEKIQPVRGNQPRKMIDLIQTLEKAVADLTELGNSGAMNNPLVIRTVECKLPDFIKRDWLTFMVEPKNNVIPDNHFDKLLHFLKEQECILERLEQLKPAEKSDHYSERKYASTKVIETKSQRLCGICGDSKHYNKLYFCKQFKDMDVKEKKASLEELGGCKRCLGFHADKCRIHTYLCKNRSCQSDHHYFLCPKTADPEKRRNTYSSKCRLTTEQERFLSELTPEMAARCTKAFTNSNSREAKRTCKSKLLQKNGLCELPVMLMLMEVTTDTNQKIGTLIDLASDTNYITHKAANRLRLRSENVTLVVYGVGGMRMTVKTKRYLLKVQIKMADGRKDFHTLICYGLDEIAKVHKVVEPLKLHGFFPEVGLEELRRPAEVELLISHREGRLAPQRLKVIQDLVLWESPLGKTVGGAHPDLVEDVEMVSHQSKTHFAQSMRTNAVKHASRKNVQTPLVSLKTLKLNTAEQPNNHWKWSTKNVKSSPSSSKCATVIKLPRTLHGQSGRQEETQDGNSGNNHHPGFATLQKSRSTRFTKKQAKNPNEYYVPKGNFWPLAPKVLGWWSQECGTRKFAPSIIHRGKGPPKNNSPFPS